MVKPQQFPLGITSIREDADVSVTRFESKVSEVDLPRDYRDRSVAIARHYTHSLELVEDGFSDDDVRNHMIEVGSQMSPEEIILYQRYVARVLDARSTMNDLREEFRDKSPKEVVKAITGVEPAGDVDVTFLPFNVSVIVKDKRDFARIYFRDGSLVNQKVPDKNMRAISHIGAFVPHLNLADPRFSRRIILYNGEDHESSYSFSRIVAHEHSHIDHYLHENFFLADGYLERVRSAARNIASVRYLGGRQGVSDVEKERYQQLLRDEEEELRLGITEYVSARFNSQVRVTVATEAFAYTSLGDSQDGANIYMQHTLPRQLTREIIFGDRRSAFYNQAASTKWALLQEIGGEHKKMILDITDYYFNASRMPDLARKASEAVVRLKIRNELTDRDVQSLLNGVPIELWEEVSKKISERMTFEVDVMALSTGTPVVYKDPNTDQLAIGVVSMQSAPIRPREESTFTKVDMIQTSSATDQYVRKQAALPTHDLRDINYPFKSMRTWYDLFNDLEGTDFQPPDTGDNEGNSISSLDFFEHIRGVCHQQGVDDISRFTRTLFSVYRKHLSRAYEH